MKGIKLLKGDITLLAVDAIVNAANSSLLGGGGVDGAIHRAAGIELFKECSTLGGCPTGEAKITKGYLLPAKHVIHTVGPVWNPARPGEMDRLLAACYQNSLKLAVEHGIRTIAFPNISTGVYNFPKERAAAIAIKTVESFLNSEPAIETGTFVCFDAENYNLYGRLLVIDRQNGEPILDN